MANDYYNYYYGQLNHRTSHFLYQNICPLIPHEAPLTPYYHSWNILNNTIIFDAIHAILVTTKFNPIVGNNRKYSYFTYFFISLVGATPSHLLQNVLLGGSWFALKSNYLALLYIVLTLYHYCNCKFPSNFLSVLRVLSNMSLVASIYFGVKRSMMVPNTAMGVFLIGILSGMGGYLWNAIVEFLWGSGKWLWLNFDYHFTRCCLLSLFWTILFKSECHIHETVEAALIWFVFFIIAIENIITERSYRIKVKTE